MKIRSLLLGSAAIAGLSTAGYAADLGVVTSLDVCDELGLSGLTISSDDNCLVITGGVSYEYDLGNYDPGLTYGSFIPNGGSTFDVNNDVAFMDASADVDVWLQFVGTANSDFGPASATIKLVSNNIDGTVDGPLVVDKAWVGIGDTTVLMAGYKSSIFNSGDDVPLNYLGLFNSEAANTGVGFGTTGADTGGDVIQVVSNLGNGVSVGGGIEDLGSGLTGVGVLSYAGDGVTAHASAAYAFDGTWKAHAGFTGTWDPISVVGAISADDTGYWNALGSVAAKFDIFTLAGSAEASTEGFGAGGSLSATVTDGVTLNLGGRYWSVDSLYQLQAGVSALVTEDITVTGDIGVVDNTVNPFAVYGDVGVAWAPKGGFTASSSVGVTSLGGYKWVFKAAKEIK